MSWWGGGKEQREGAEEDAESSPEQKEVADGGVELEPPEGESQPGGHPADGAGDADRGELAVMVIQMSEDERICEGDRRGVQECVKTEAGHRRIEGVLLCGCEQG